MNDTVSVLRKTGGSMYPDCRSGVFKSYRIREFMPHDSAAVNRVALSAFQEYASSYSDWATFRSSIGRIAAFSETAEVIVAELEQGVVGAVAYVGPFKPKAQFFDQAWPIMRMLVVEPVARGLGIGRRLAEECIRRAERDRASAIALHTAEIMPVALAMYQRIGFVLHKQAPEIHGVRYGIYIKKIRA